MYAGVGKVTVSGNVSAVPPTFTTIQAIKYNNPSATNTIFTVTSGKTARLLSVYWSVQSTSTSAGNSVGIITDDSGGYSLYNIFAVGSAAITSVNLVGGQQWGYGEGPTIASTKVLQLSTPANTYAYCTVVYYETTN